MVYNINVFKRIYTVKYFWLIMLIATLVAIDLAIKHIVSATMTLDDPVKVIPGFFSLVYTHNTGASFGMLAGMRWLFLTVTSLLLIILAVVFWRSQYKDNKLFISGFVFLFAGAIGNFIDRIFFAYVRDYFSIHFFPAVFNLADVFINIGTLLIIIFIIKTAVQEYKNKKSTKPKNEEADDNNKGE